MQLNVVILAAGRGKRMRSARPKVLHELAGQPLLAHVIDSARALKASRICVVYGHGGEAVPKAIAAVDIRWVKQEPQLGTGHALQQALPHVSKAPRTLVLYGDVPLVRTAALRALLKDRSPRVGILTAELADPGGYGRVVRDLRGQVTGIVEHKDANAAQHGIREINTGIMVLPTARLARWLGKLKNDNAQREFYLPDIVKLAIADRIPVEAVPAGAAWETTGVNSKAQLAQLERLYQERIAATLLDAGVSLADPARLDVRGSLECGKDVFIDVGCIFEGRTRLGDGVRVGPYCVLRDVAVAAGTRIEAYSHIVEAAIGANCRVGPYARIRPGTRLATGVHVGNFVEVKNSVIGGRSKANHLAYVGDARVGARVNIGAGTITCNYDGVNKHRTVIEDDAFIGSNTELVAPVAVRRGATIGAGSTITRDAPARQLTLARARQVSVPGWKRPRKRVRDDE